MDIRRSDVLCRQCNTGGHFHGYYSEGTDDRKEMIFVGLSVDSIDEVTCSFIDLR